MFRTRVTRRGMRLSTPASRLRRWRGRPSEMLRGDDPWFEILLGIGLLILLAGLYFLGALW